MQIPTNELNPIIELIIQYPKAAAVVAVIGTFRLIFKPFMSFLHEFVNITATKKDNQILEKIEKSKAWKVFIYLLDWFGSIKLPKKPKLL